MTLLTRSGTVVRDPAGGLAVAFEAARCAGCDGRCGLRLGRTQPLALPGLPAGTVVTVVASAQRLRRRAGVVFGVPLAAAAGSAAVLAGSAWSDAWSELWALGAVLAGLALPLVLRRFAGPTAWSVCHEDGKARVELR